MGKVEVIMEYNALLDIDEAKKGNIVKRKDYDALLKEIDKPLEKMNNQNPDLEVVYLLDVNTKEFSVFRNNLLDDKQKEVVIEFLVYLNQKASEFLK